MALPADRDGARPRRSAIRTSRRRRSTRDFARRSSSSPRRRSAAASSRRLSASRADGSTRKSKPVRWPIGSGPTLTSPSAATVTGKRIRAARADVADEHRGAAVDEALGQPLVQRVATAALRPRGCARPIWRARRASRRGGRYRPSCECPARRSASASMSPLTLSSRGHFGGEPFVRDVAALADVAEKPADHARMVHRPDLAEIGQAARGPQPARDGAALGGDRRILGDQLQHREVDRLRRGRAATDRRCVASRLAISARTSVKSRSGLRQ